MHEEFGPFQTHTTSVCILKEVEVTLETLEEVLGVTPFEQHLLINAGDSVSVFYFHSGSLANSGTLTIWHNKNQAAIKTAMSQLSGEWLESQRLIVSDELEVGWTMQGELVTGRIAMDVNGFQGVYSCGQFYCTSVRCAVGY